MKIQKNKKITNDKNNNIQNKELVNGMEEKGNNNNNKRIHDSTIAINIQENNNNNNGSNNANQKNIFLKKLFEEYVNIPLMKRMDQYFEELKKENITIPSHLDVKIVFILDNFGTLEEVFENYNNDTDSEKNKDIRFILIAQYLFYTWLKKNNLLQNNNENISEENKKQFLQWASNI